MSDASVMAPHEWYTHGTCSGVDRPNTSPWPPHSADEVKAMCSRPIFVQSRGPRLSPSSRQHRRRSVRTWRAGDRVN